MKSIGRSKRYKESLVPSKENEPAHGLRVFWKLHMIKALFSDLIEPKSVLFC